MTIAALMAALSLICTSLKAGIRVTGEKENYGVEFVSESGKRIHSPGEGLWSVATSWGNNWMGDWKHASANKKETVNGWTILQGEIDIDGSKMIVRDAYKEIKPGLVKAVRRFHWTGDETLKNITLSVRLIMDGDGILPFLPGICYYGNPAGAKINSKIIPVYSGKEGEFAIFEEHRYGMPFAMLENAGEKFAAAVHTIPSPVRGAVLADQWWSLGVECVHDATEFVMFSGPVGYNGQRSVAKSLQHKPMRYSDTYVNMEAGQVIEKEFYVECYDIENKGSGFQRPVYTSMDIHKPFDAERFPDYEEIVRSKVSFAMGRWIEGGDAQGFCMYEPEAREEIVMGWCGQAASPGFALQYLRDYTDMDKKVLDERIRESLDFLTSYPMNEDGTFKVGYNLKTKEYFGGDHVSCGQAMYNMAKAIEKARKDKKLDTGKWEAFLGKACDAQARRILDESWKPYSTAEAFYVAPLSIASRLFKNETYKKAALKAADVFAERHLSMEEPYWGGTLDATCEDKEGAWAAFQAFLEVYERFGDEKYLKLAKHAMDVCLSYVAVWDIPLPAGRLADHNFKTTGWTVVSPQNQHLDVYGVLFAPEVYKMGLRLRNENLRKLAKVMYRTCFQLTDPYGSQGEQIQQTNFAQRGDMSNVHKLRGGYAEKWTVFWITAHFINAAARFEEMGVRP